MTMKRENWLPVEGYEGIYEISDLGRVRSLGNDKTRKTKILKPHDNGHGYVTVTLYKDGKTKMVLVHRLVATTFVPNIFSLNEVNHINEVKTDNRESNLMWCEHRENINWGTHNQRMSETNTNGKLSKTVLQFSKSGEFIQEWPSASEVERVLGFFQGGISKCCLGKCKSYKGFIWKYKVS